MAGCDAGFTFRLHRHLALLRIFVGLSESSFDQFRANPLAKPPTRPGHPCLNRTDYWSIGGCRLQCSVRGRFSHLPCAGDSNCQGRLGLKHPGSCLLSPCEVARRTRTLLEVTLSGRRRMNSGLKKASGERIADCATHRSSGRKSLQETPARRTCVTSEKGDIEHVVGSGVCRISCQRCKIRQYFKWQRAREKPAFNFTVFDLSMPSVG